MKNRDVDGTALTQSEMNPISFHNGGGGCDSFRGTGYQILGGPFANEEIPLPEPEIYATAMPLLLGAGRWFFRKGMVSQS
jgi:hypothetical protein